MGARQRLNSIYATRILIIATLCGTVTESWGIFALVAIAMAAISVHGGSIRPSPLPQHRRRFRHR